MHTFSNSVSRVLRCFPACLRSRVPTAGRAAHRPISNRFRRAVLLVSLKKIQSIYKLVNFMVFLAPPIHTLRWLRARFLAIKNSTPPHNKKLGERTPRHRHRGRRRRRHVLAAPLPGRARAQGADSGVRCPTTAAGRHAARRAHGKPLVEEPPLRAGQDDLRASLRGAAPRLRAQHWRRPDGHRK